MNNYIRNFIIAAVCIASASFLASCDSDAGLLPKIAFKKTAGYVYTDTTAKPGDTLKVGIDASKSEDEDVLKVFNVSQKYDSGTTTTVLNENLSGSQGDSYSRDIQIIMRSIAGTETYTFSVVNRDGITNAVSLKVTVK